MTLGRALQVRTRQHPKASDDYVDLQILFVSCNIYLSSPKHYKNPLYSSLRFHVPSPCPFDP